MVVAKPKGKSIVKPYRHELKYYLNQGEAFLLGKRLALTMRRDANANEYGEYHIRSLYFDDCSNTAMQDKLDGVEERKKFRIRIYNIKDDVIKLECKEKQGQFITKSSLALTREQCDLLIAQKPTFLLGLGDPLAMEMYHHMRTRLLKPAVIVDYIREAFVYPFQDVRITFDKDLHTGVFSKDLFDPNLPTVRAIEGYDTILEVKFNKFLPAYFHQLVQTDSLQRCAISKFCIARKFE